MATNSFKVNKSISLYPQAGAPASPTNGDVYYDSGVGSFAYRVGNLWSYQYGIQSVAGATDLTSTAMTVGPVSGAIIRITGSATNLHGMSASFNGKALAVLNATAGPITIRNVSLTEATSNNRIKTPSGADMTLIAGEVASFIYDSAQTSWLVVAIGSGVANYLVATTTTNGVVRLNTTPGAPSNPLVAAIDSSGLAQAAGLTRGALAAGTLLIGTNTNDSAVTVGKSGADLNFPGVLRLTDIRPSNPVTGGLVNIGPTSYDTTFKSKVIICGNEDPSLSRNAVGSAPVRFVNNGNKDTVGTGLISEWYTNTNSGLTRVAALDSAGLLTVATISVAASASTTLVSNLNSALLLGGTWAIPGTIGSTTPNTAAFSTLTASVGTASTQVGVQLGEYGSLWGDPSSNPGVTLAGGANGTHPGAWVEFATWQSAGTNTASISASTGTGRITINRTGKYRVTFRANCTLGHNNRLYSSCVAVSGSTPSIATAFPGILTFQSPPPDESINMILAPGATGGTSTGDPALGLYEFVSSKVVSITAGQYVSAWFQQANGNTSPTTGSTSLAAYRPQLIVEYVGP